MREENEKIDARDLRDGGWYWVQQELLYVFTPLIGPEASWLYTVLCRLIPDKVENPHIELTIRAMQRASGLSVGTVHRKLAVLIAIGMIEETKRGNRTPSIFKLVSLRKLAGVGNAELQRRLSVPPGNSGKNEGGSAPDQEDVQDDAESRTDGVDKSSTVNDVAAAVAKAPAGSQAPTVPVGNSEADSVQNADLNPALFQKGGGTVPKEGGYCSSEKAPLIKNLSILTTSPLTPTQARGGRLRSVAASVEGRPPEKSKDLPVEDQDLHAAVVLVMRESNLSNPRMVKTITLAMRTHAARTDEKPDWNAIAERMVRGYTAYLENKHLMKFPVGVKKFFDDGLWLDDRRWPWDEHRVREQKRL
jgi:hypothetical protein